MEPEGLNPHRKLSAKQGSPQSLDPQKMKATVMAQNQITPQQWDAGQQPHRSQTCYHKKALPFLPPELSHPPPEPDCQKEQTASEQGQNQIVNFSYRQLPDLHAGQGQASASFIVRVHLKVLHLSRHPDLKAFLPVSPFQQNSVAAHPLRMLPGFRRKEMQGAVRVILHGNPVDSPVKLLRLPKRQSLPVLFRPAYFQGLLPYFVFSSKGQQCAACQQNADDRAQDPFLFHAFSFLFFSVPCRPTDRSTSIPSRINTGTKFTR